MLHRHPSSRSRARRILIALCALTWLPGGALADPPPLPPISDDFGIERKADWVQIVSGEWLRGEVLRMHDQKLYFDSKEFDEAEIDWGDVLILVSDRPHSFRTTGNDILIGPFELRDGVVTVATASGTETIPKDAVLGLIPGSGREIDYWSAKVTFSLGIRKGNTDQIDYQAKVNVTRQTPNTRFVNKYLGDFASINGAETANSHRVTSLFDLYLTRRFFVTVPTFEYFTDSFQNINTRLTGGALLGYDILKRKRVDWEIAAGAAYQYTGYISVEPGQSIADNDAAVVFSTAVNFDLPRGIEWDNSYNLQVVVTDIDKTSHHVVSVLSFDIWGPLDFDTTFVFDRIESPVRSADGTLPVSNDYRLTVGLGFDI
jgi:hypothetical protein